MKTQQVLASKVESTQEHQQDIVSSSPEKFHAKEPESRHFTAGLLSTLASDTDNGRNFRFLFKIPQLHELANASLRNQAFFQMQRNHGNQYVQRMFKSGTLQAKLKIGKPRDKYELEADRVAKQVMRMPQPLVQKQPDEEEEEDEMLQTKSVEISPLGQRQTEEEREGEEEEIIQTKGDVKKPVRAYPSIESHISSLKGLNTGPAIQLKEKSLPRLDAVIKRTGLPEMGHHWGTRYHKWLINKGFHEIGGYSGFITEQDIVPESEEEYSLMFLTSRYEHPDGRKAEIETEYWPDRVEEKVSIYRDWSELNNPLYLEKWIIPKGLYVPPYRRRKIKRTKGVKNEVKTQITPLIQRQPIEEKKKEEEELLQTKGIATETPEVTPDLSADIMSIKWGGKPLPERTRALMEQRFGHDFSRVRIHTDNRTAETARGLNARAFTVGRDVAFAPGWNPESEAGRRLLAHELAHVMQQTGAEPGAGGTVSGTPVIQRDDGSGGVNETGRTSTQPPANQPATVMQRAEDEDDGLDFWELYSKAIMEQPHLMASKCQEYVNTIAPVLADLPKYDSFFDSVYDVYWGFWKLAFELLQMKKDSKTTDNQRLRANRLAEKWISIKEGMEAANYWRTKTRLIEAARATEQLRIQLTYAYGDIYHAGKEPEDVKVGSSNMKDLAEKGVDLLKVINEADAAITVRNVTPIIPVLEKTLTVVNLITGWKVTSSLASESQKGIAALQNAWNLANAGLSLGGFGKFLPLFGHIGPLLDGIAKGWARVVSKLREHNRIWWQLRDVLGEDVPYPKAFPGGREVLAYMRAVFRASHPLKSKPSKKVVDFFDDNREMFSRTAKEVLGKEWGDVPTRRSWLFWREVDPYELNDWVFYNREMTWRLIYGRGMDFPD